MIHPTHCLVQMKLMILKHLLVAWTITHLLTTRMATDMKQLTHFTQHGQKLENSAPTAVVSWRSTASKV